MAADGRFNHFLLVWTVKVYGTVSDGGDKETPFSVLFDLARHCHAQRCERRLMTHYELVCLLGDGVEEELEDGVTVWLRVHLCHVVCHMLHHGTYGAPCRQSGLLSPAHSVCDGHYAAILTRDDPKHVCNRFSDSLDAESVRALAVCLRAVFFIERGRYPAGKVTRVVPVACPSDVCWGG